MDRWIYGWMDGWMVDIEIERMVFKTIFTMDGWISAAWI